MGVPVLHEERLCPVLVDIQPAPPRRSTAVSQLLMLKLYGHLQHYLAGNWLPYLAKRVVQGCPGMRKYARGLDW